MRENNKPRRKPVRRSRPPARRPPAVPPHDLERAKREAKEKAAQRAEIDAIRKKWKQEREDFLANSREPSKPSKQSYAQEKNSPPVSYHEDQPIRSDSTGSNDHPQLDMNTYERALKDARIQVEMLCEILECQEYKYVNFHSQCGRLFNSNIDEVLVEL